MRDVTMPNGDVVSFPDDMPAARIQSLIASKFPKEVEELLAKTGQYRNGLEALATGVGNLPADITATKHAIGQMAYEAAREFVVPTMEPGRTIPLEDIVMPGAPIEDMLNAPAAPTYRGLGIGSLLPDEIKEPIARAAAYGALGQELRRKYALDSKKPLNVRPGSLEEIVASAGASTVEMAGPAALSLLVRNPAPLVAYFAARSGGEGYAKAREEGSSVGNAQLAAGLYAAAETVTEGIAGKIFIEGGKTLLRTVLKSGAVEGLTEGVTEALQALVDSGVIGIDMTLEDALERVKLATLTGSLSGGMIAGVTYPLRKDGTAAPSVPNAVPGPQPDAPQAPAVPSLPPPAEQLALPSPEAYATPDIVRRQPAAPEPLVEPAPVPSEIEQQAKDALKRSRQAETAALLQTARETVSPIGAFEATELPADVAIKVNTSRARRGRSIDTPITVEDMVRAKVPQEQIDAAIALRKPLTAGRQLTPRDVRTAARAKNIRLDSNFDELARRATGATNVEGMSQTQLSVLHDVISGLPAHDAPVSIPIADQNPFTETQYDKAVAAVRKQGRYTLAAIKEGSGLKSDADARAVRAAMVRRGQLVQRGKDDYRLYDNLGAQTKPTPADLPNAAFVEHVVRKMPVGAVTVQQNGRSKGKFASEAEASDAVRKIRDEEAKGGVTGPARAKIEIRPAGRVAYGVIENRYDEQGNFLGQATVDTYDNEAAARTAADKLNAPDRATPRPETAAAQAAAAEARPPGNFVVLKDGKPLAGFNTAAEVREELRRLRDENRQLGLKEPDLAIERAPRVTEAAPTVPVSPKVARKPPAPATIAGRVADVMAGLSAIGNTRGLPLLGTKVSLTDVVAGLTGTPVEGTFSPSKNLIRLSLHHLKPGMTTEEIVDTLAGVMDHETIHALKTAGVLDPSSEAWKTLVNYAKKATNKKLSAERKKQLAENRLSESFFDVARLLYTGRPGYESPQDIEEEAIAEVFRHWAADRRSVVGKPATALRQIVEWFKRLIRAVPEDLLRSIESGELVRQFKAPGSDTPRARTTEAMAQAKTGMAAAQATGDKPRAQENVRRYVRARDQAREDRYGRAGAKTVIGDTPSQAYATGEAPDPLEAENVLRRYGEVSGQPAPPLRVYLPEPMAFLQKLAAAQEKAKHNPKADAVAKAYRALTAETRTMFDALGVKVEVFTGPGEPYTSQRAMFEDIVQNKRVKLRLSTAQFGLSPDNAGHPMYAASGVTATDGTALTHNDLLRIVHEVYGHAPNGLRYQPRDAYNAYHAHRLLYSKDAVPALLTETLAQSAWQNYGAHMRRSDGTVPQLFDSDYLPLDQRQYAEQKAYILPEMVFEDPGVQAAAEAEQAEELRLSVGQDNEPTVIRLADVRERKQLETMHGQLMRDVRTRAGEISAATRAAVDAGVFDGVEIGDRLSSRNVKGDPLPPMKVEGRFLREWKGRSQAAPFERAGKKPTLVEFNGTQYVPMLRVLQGEGPPANATPQQQEEWDAAHPNAEWSRFDVPLDLVRDRRMGGLRAVRPVGDERYSVNSTEFQSWFGQSAVSQNGMPLRVFHATSRASFDEFDTHRSELGTHFGTIAQAHTMANGKMEEAKGDWSRGKMHDVGVHIYPVYLSIQRPLRLRDEGAFGNSTVAAQLADLNMISYEEAGVLSAYGYQNRRALQDVIKAHGYDGVVYMNRLEGRPIGGDLPSDIELYGLSDRMFRKKYPYAADSWIIFEPTQAKSAIANRGTYDPNNPDMRESIGNERFEAYAQRADNELSPMERSALPGIERGLVGPIPAAVLAAREYAKAAGLPIRRQSTYVKVDVPRAQRIAQAYADMRHAPQDPAVRAAYQAMIDETVAQYKAVRATGLHVEAIKEGMEDPYPNGPRDVLRDIANGHIWYFPTKSGFGSDASFDPRTNPLLTETDEVSDNGEPMLVNDLFRVVHDFFGHGLEGTGFGARGEENAWQSHVRLFSDRAVPAMTSETRGQNSWVNFGPFGERNRANPRDTVYADQKTGIMPEWTWREGIEDDRRESVSGPDVPVQTSDVPSFVAAFDKARDASPFGKMVHRYADEDYEQMRVFLSPDGMSGFAIKSDNDIVSVFANPAGSRGRLPSIMAQAIANGGRKLDAFGAGLPEMYAKYGFVETGRMAWDDLYAPDGWDYEKFGRPDIVFMSYAGPEAQAEAGDTMRYSLGDKQLIDDVIGLRGALRYLDAAEQERLTTRTARRFVELFSSFPDAKEMAAVAYSGRAKRGWYRNSAEAIIQIFGAYDAPRFAALMAALSPQISVEGNAINALNVWVEWVRSNRTPDPDAILRILERSVQGTKGKDSVLDAWNNNVVRALTTEDPATIVLSGPKVNSFARNLRNIVNEVTNDAWMANYANIDQELFRPAYVKAPPSDPLGGKIGVQGPGYLAMAAVTRKAAAIATRMTGETWTPHEIQETVWSWTKVLYEKAERENLTAREILAAGRLTHAEIAATPDFATLFIGGVYRNILEKGGYANALRALEGSGKAYDPDALGGSPLTAEGSGFAQRAFEVHLRRAARRLESLSKARAEAKAITLAANKAHKEPNIGPDEAEPPLREEDWDEKYSVTSPLFDETYGARLPGGRLYGNNDIDPATALSQPGVSPVPLSVPVDGGEFFGGRLAEAQLRMAQDGIDGASMVYMRVEDFLRLAGDVIHPRQEVFNSAVTEGMKFNGLPSIWFDGNDGVVRVLAMDGDYAVRALAGRADRVPVIIQRKGNQYFGSLVGFETPNGTTAMPNGGLREFYPERRGERMSVGSEAFNKWFGDSKVVDEQGKPLVVYHSTHVWTRDGRTLGDFNVFDRMASVTIVGRQPSMDNVGLWFGSYVDPSKDAGAYGTVIYPVYLSIKRPWRPPSFMRFLEKMHETAGSPFTGAAALPKTGPKGRGNVEPLREWLMYHGYDGIVFPEGSVDMPGQTVWVALEPTQIKSAIGNRGTWSAANPDIRESLNSPVGTRKVPQIDPDTYSVLHRETTSWLGRQMERIGRGDIGKADVPLVGETRLFRGIFGGSSIYEMRVANEDQFLSLFEFNERVRKEGGKITDEQNSYIAQQAAGSKATQRIQQHQSEIYDPLLAAIKAAHKAKKFTLREYEDFLYARHAPERNAFLRARGSKEPNPSGMSEAEAAAIIDRFTRSGKIKDMLALDPLLDKLRKSITTTRVAGGLLAPDAVSSAYTNWVPMQNGEDFDPFDQVSKRSSFTGRGMSVAGRENRPVVGRGSKAGDLLSNMILQDTLAVVRSEHAAFNRKLVETIVSNPTLAKQDIEILSKPPLKTVVGSDGRIRAIVDPNFRSAPGVYVTKIAGREVVLRVHNPWIERALKGDFVQQTGPLVQVIGSVTRVLAAMRTTYNPTFVLTNFSRDLQAAALNLAPQEIKGLTGRMLAGVPRAGKAVGAYLLNGDTSTEHGRYYKEMLENGWTVSHMGLQTLETVVDRVRKDAHSATGWRLTASQASKATRDIFGALEATLGVMENGVRLSAYVEARRAGASIAQAGYLAKNMTVNFNKRGERSGAMNMLYMFYNAGVQGGSVLANMAKSKRGQRLLAGIITTGFVLDVINRMFSSDDNDDGLPDYDQFSEYELSHNLIFPNPLAVFGMADKPRYLKFPMPLGYNAAHNLGRNLSNMFVRKNKTWVDSLASIATGTADALNPIAAGGDFLNFVMPTFLDPLVDIAANTDYAGRDIVPERPSYGVEPPMSQRYWSSTDKSFVDIAAFLNNLTGGNEVRKGAIDWSPEVIDYWSAFVAGGVGRFLLDMKYNITEGAPLAISGKFEDIDTTRLPLINVIVGSNVDRAASSQYYEINKEAMTVEEEVKRFVEIGDPARARAARAARPVEYAMSKMFAGTDKQISSLRKQIRKVEEGRANDELKAKQIKRLRDQIDELMARALKAYYRAKDAIK